MMGFVTDTTFAKGYTDNPYNFNNFKIKLINLLCNGMPVPRFSYQPNVTKKIYNTDYYTFQEQLGFDQGDRCENLTNDE